MTIFRENAQTTSSHQGHARRVTIAICAVLLLVGAPVFAGQPQAHVGPAPDAAASAPSAASADNLAPGPNATVAAPRYSASEISQMFNYIDRNKDGSISREEAASFPGVARHFDEADTNKDKALSRQEFEAAMQKVK